MACQSLDNQIVVYGAGERLKINRKKHFAGHLVAGYACKPGFSPDGKFLSSGDSNGNVWVWDWKTCKILKKFKAHNKVVVNTEWHPHETSKMATCSWDGVSCRIISFIYSFIYIYVQVFNDFLFYYFSIFTTGIKNNKHPTLCNNNLFFRHMPLINLLF